MDKMERVIQDLRDRNDALNHLMIALVRHNERLRERNETLERQHREDLVHALNLIERIAHPTDDPLSPDRPCPRLVPLPLAEAARDAPVPPKRPRADTATP